MRERKVYVVIYMVLVAVLIASAVWSEVRNTLRFRDLGEQNNFQATQIADLEQQLNAQTTRITTLQEDVWHESLAPAVISSCIIASNGTKEVEIKIFGFSPLVTGFYLQLESLITRESVVFGYQAGVSPADNYKFDGWVNGIRGGKVTFSAGEYLLRGLVTPYLDNGIPSVGNSLLGFETAFSIPDCSK